VARLNDPEITFTSDNADTFIAGDASKTLTLKGALHTRGTVNIGYSLDIKGTNKVDGMENRGVGLCVLSGTTNIGGNVSLNDGEALFVKSGALGIQGDVNMASTVYNYGKMYILGNLNVDWSKTQYITDKEKDDMHQGYSLKTVKQSVRLMHIFISAVQMNLNFTVLLKTAAKFILMQVCR
jgi:hypothetical protein